MPRRLAFLLVWFAAASASAQVSIEVGRLAAAPGAAASVAVVLRTERGDIGGLGNTVRWSGPFSVVDCRVPGATSPTTAFAYSPPGCSAAACTAVRAVALSLTGAPIAGGAVLYICDVLVRGDAGPGTYGLTCDGPEAATLAGVEVDAECVDGFLNVTAASPTPSPSVPPSSTATALPELACAGDCDGDGRVSVDEVVSAVRAALDGTDPCPAVDTDEDDLVSIGELIRAVSSLLNGCDESRG